MIISLANSQTIDNNLYGCFIIQPLEIGRATTLANSLRRTLLSDLSSYTITGIRINRVRDEFSSILGVREDVLEVLCNLKEVIFKESISFKNWQKKKQFSPKIKAFLNVKGPCIVTAKMFQLPKGLLKIINPEQYICTIIQPCELYLEIDIENGTNYRLIEEEAITTKVYEDFFPEKGNTLVIDALFIPVKTVNFQIYLISDTQGNLKESLKLEILTNGSITPQRALLESLKSLIDLFSSLFVDLQISKKDKEGESEDFDSDFLNENLKKQSFDES